MEQEKQLCFHFPLSDVEEPNVISASYVFIQLLNDVMFKWSKAGLDSEFSFFLTDFLTVVDQ